MDTLKCTGSEAQTEKPARTARKPPSLFKRKHSKNGKAGAKDANKPKRAVGRPKKRKTNLAPVPILAPEELLVKELVENFGEADDNVRKYIEENPEVEQVPSDYRNKAGWADVENAKEARERWIKTRVFMTGVCRFWLRRPGEGSLRINDGS